MKALFVSPECHPLVKTGGLADVVGALPLALASAGVDSRVLVPGYPGLRDHLQQAKRLAALPRLFGGDAEIIAGTTADGLQVWLLDAPHLYERKGGGPYLGPDGADWHDNHIRFAALSWVAAQIALGAPGPWRPDVVHLHDWQSALTAAYLHFDTRPAPPTLLTVHNLAFQGIFPRDVAAGLRLPSTAIAVDGMEYWGRISFLKAGVLWADHINTVSPTYAQEILTPNEGMGFDGLLAARGSHVNGIVNGIDDRVWDPSADTLLAATYSADDLAGKAVNKATLQRELGLAVRDDVPLFCVVSRLTAQKGLDLLLEALPILDAHGAQLAVLGTGERGLEEGFRQAAAQNPTRIAAAIGFDEALSHRIQAGADAILVPSRFEPCGLTQLYGLRYGTLPVVARVGGLADTVIDANEAALRDGVATGFQFSPVDSTQLGAAIRRACRLFENRPAWTHVQQRAMTRDVSWTHAADEYLALYHRLTHSTAHR